MEKLSLRVWLLPTALPWKESLWDDFSTLWGWVGLSCLVARGSLRGLVLISPGVWSPEFEPSALEVWGWEMVWPKQCCHSRCTISKYDVQY